MQRRTRSHIQPDWPRFKIGINLAPDGGLLGGLLGRGKDGIPAGHSWDGSGKGGWPIVGDKNNKLSVSRVIVEELSKYKKERFVPARALSKTAN